MDVVEVDLGLLPVYHDHNCNRNRNHGLLCLLQNGK